MKVDKSLMDKTLALQGDITGRVFEKLMGHPDEVVAIEDSGETLYNVEGSDYVFDMAPIGMSAKVIVTEPSVPSSLEKFGNARKHVERVVNKFIEDGDFSLEARDKFDTRLASTEAMYGIKVKLELSTKG